MFVVVLLVMAPSYLEGGASGKPGALHFIIRIDGNIRWREGSHQRAVEPVISLDDRLKTASKKRRDTLQVTASPTSVFRKKTLKTDFITNRRIDYRRAGYLFLVE